MMEIGPIAVHPEFQKQGYGSKLMDTVERRGNASKCTVGVVSCRTDIIPFFEKRGYKVRKLFESEFWEVCTHGIKSLTIPLFILSLAPNRIIFFEKSYYYDPP